jgi:prephenate dehydrogenase
MCGGNAAAVRAALDDVLASLGTAREALDTPDPIGALTGWLRPGAAARAGWPASPSEPTRLPAEVDVLLRLGRAGGWVESVAADQRSVSAARPLTADPTDGSPAGR